MTKTMLEEKNIINQVMKFLEILQGLNDCHLSFFLQELRLNEDGFRIVGIDNGHIVFSVPKQDLEQWYTDNTTRNCQLTDKKRTIAKDIKKQFKLVLYEPPNDREDLKLANKTSRRHFEFYTQKESFIACVHPNYLKIAVKDGSIRLDVARLFSKIKKFYLQ